MAERVWERQEKESPQAFAAFEQYRRLPPEERSLQRAWDTYRNWTSGRKAPDPEPAGKPHGHWTRWMGKHQWKARALSWDAWVAASARSQELAQALKARREAGEEDHRQRLLRREEARAARAVGSGLLRRLLKEADTGSLDQLQGLELLRHLPKITTLIAMGHHLERLAQEELDAAARREVPRRAMLELLKDLVPVDRWEELADLLDSLTQSTTG